MNISKSFLKPSFKLVIFRFLKNIVGTYNSNILGNFIDNLFIKIKRGRTSYRSVKEQLKRISGLQIKVSAKQIQRFQNLHQKRKNIGLSYYCAFKNKGFLINSGYDPQESSFTKFFVYNPILNTEEEIIRLKKLGIEAMHLEHKQKSPYQQKLTSGRLTSGQDLNNYHKVHDSIVSIPLQENFTDEDVNFIVKSILR